MPLSLRLERTPVTTNPIMPKLLTLTGACQKNGIYPNKINCLFDRLPKKVIKIYSAYPGESGVRENSESGLSVSWKKTLICSEIGFLR